MITGPKVLINPCTSEGTCCYAEQAYPQCYVCHNEIGSSTDSVHLIYKSQFDFEDVQYLGELCEVCQRKTPQQVAGRLDERRNVYAQTVEEGTALVRNLIMQAEQVKQHLVLLESLIVKERSYVNRSQSFLEEMNRLRLPTVEWLKVRSSPNHEENVPDLPIYKKSAPAGRSRNGYIYLIASPEGHYKIGRTRDVPTRINAIALQLPFPVELIHSIEVTDAVWAEKFLHEKFGACRMNGEWFLLSDTDINWVKALTSLEVQQVT